MDCEVKEPGLVLLQTKNSSYDGLLKQWTNQLKLKQTIIKEDFKTCILKKLIIWSYCFTSHL